MKCTKATPGQIGPVHGFTAVEITGSVMIAFARTAAFSRILLLSNDVETLAFAGQNMAQLVSNALMVKQSGNSRERSDDGNRRFAEGIESLFETLILRPEKNVLHRLTASLKKAILSIALERYHADKAMICKVLGLSSSQFDDEMRSSGFALLVNEER